MGVAPAPQATCVPATSPSGCHGPMRPIQRLVARSITENMEKPCTVQAPAIMHMLRHAALREDGPAEQAHRLGLCGEGRPGLEILLRRHAGSGAACENRLPGPLSRTGSLSASIAERRLGRLAALVLLVAAWRG